ncbi:hypothetical protein AYI69_g9683 [Smittium culicis]|uniref:Uncharacterized protein n=1 Tax=Smittium culicis TaxID=133412 RepID=A0A1R1XB53_9FUNG|nr:hypothetical protein AYI69_g9683 [Smittium culicis]
MLISTILRSCSESLFSAATCACSSSILAASSPCFDSSVPATSSSAKSRCCSASSLRFCESRLRCDSARIISAATRNTNDSPINSAPASTARASFRGRTASLLYPRMFLRQLTCALCDVYTSLSFSSNIIVIIIWLHQVFSYLIIYSFCFRRN